MSQQMMMYLSKLWNRLTWTQRESIAVCARQATPPYVKIEASKLWEELPVNERILLAEVDWNFATGGKIGKIILDTKAKFNVNS